MRVLEAKGGSSQVTKTYGAWQGTNRNAIRSAEFVLESRKASPLQKLAAARVIKAAQVNRLQTGVVKTSHVLGMPDAPHLEGGWSSENVVKEAEAIERRVTRRNPAAVSAFRSAAAAQSSAMLRYRAAQGKWFLPLAVGVEGLSAGIAYYEYSTGRIGLREFYRRSTGTAIFAVFTTGGAIIGGVVGAPAGGVGALPGAGAGAGIGALAAVPVQFVADWTWNWYYRKFDEKQRAAVDRAVERHYGLSSQ